MEPTTASSINYGLEQHGITNIQSAHWNLPEPRLYEQVIRRREGRLASSGPLIVRTGQYTGRTPLDKYLVREPSSADELWWGDVNRAMEEECFETLYRRLLAYWQGRDLFVQDAYAGAGTNYQLPIRVITETAWHSLFVRNMFTPLSDAQQKSYVPEFTVFHAPNFHAITEVDCTRSEVFIVIHFGRRMVLIGGTHYAGEIKKSIFTVLNYLLPPQNVLSMHCSANKSQRGETAVFFGLSGTGKTTLSNDSQRILIGDDEHGWSGQGVFNFEGGCYAKTIHLSKDGEPLIYSATRQFGTILENVGFDSETGQIDLDDAALTENTRAAYPLSHLANADINRVGGHPKHIIMLTADAFGILPPVARLTREQAMYHFLSGYTAKVAGTERGVSEPKATFSACFGAPFLARPPIVYAELLGKKIKKHGSQVWLINTGWSGGPYGEGERIKLRYTRTMVDAVLKGELDDIPMRQDPFFNVAVPENIPGVPADLLQPRRTWKNKAAYDKQAKHLARMYIENFEDFEQHVSEEIKAAGPVLA
jgi:phosphoenolpyruvate carboxykinase (ATP)